MSLISLINTNFGAAIAAMTTTTIASIIDATISTFTITVMNTVVATRFPLTRKVRELSWSGKSGNFVDGHGKMMCIVRVVVYFC